MQEWQKLQAHFALEYKRYKLFHLLKLFKQGQSTTYSSVRIGIDRSSIMDNWSVTHRVVNARKSDTNTVRNVIERYKENVSSEEQKPRFPTIKDLNPS